MCFGVVFLRTFPSIKLLACAVVGFIFAYFAFFIASLNLGLNNLDLINNILIIILFILAIGLIFIKSNPFFIKEGFFILLSFAYSGKYFFISKEFKILSQAYLDNTAIASAFFILEAIIIIFLCMQVLKHLEKFKMILLKVFCASFFVMAFGDALSHVFLFLMRDGELNPEKILLSFVAKGLYYSHFYSYFILAFIMILALLSLNFIPRKIHKKQILDINYRLQKGLKQSILLYFSFALVAFLASWGTLGYYDLIASKGLSIGTPVIVEPNKDGNFVFDVKMLRDNKLHRFAYVEDDGRISRFFLLNKREDRDSPVAVFDACKICGDMGYVKRGHELICVSCNVRIFLPSVGKEGGCNPITMKYKVENGKVIISLKQIKEGLGFFRNKMKKEVIDIIGGEKLINLDAPYFYEFEGKTYFFANKKHYLEFKANPASFVKKGLSNVH